MSGAHAGERGVITFISDYGLRDEFVGICHAVIARRAPAARVIDITHAIPRHDVRAGAEALRDALPYVAAGVHLAVVDPGVGAAGAQARRAVALVCAAGGALVGPDNGLLAPAAERLGGVVGAVEISRSRERLQPVSRTFHGRDIFAPVAAALAAGEPLESLGEPLAPSQLRRLELARALVRDGALHARVLRIDVFGNVTLDARGTQLEQAGAHGARELSVERAAGSVRARRAHAFADVPRGELLLYEDSRGMLALAVNGESAAQKLGLRAGDQLVLRAP